MKSFLAFLARLVVQPNQLLSPHRRDERVGSESAEAQRMPQRQSVDVLATGHTRQIRRFSTRREPRVRPRAEE
jgi:hypothetical protein